jgi:hypothetical protein
VVIDNFSSIFSVAKQLVLNLVFHAAFMVLIYLAVSCIVAALLKLLCHF